MKNDGSGKECNKKKRTILHLDMDMFFAAVELLDQPELKGKPVVVGGPSERRGVVACASYPARKFGIRAGMPNVQAIKLCPELIFITPNFDKYARASQRVQKIISHFSPHIEMFSIDEAFIDITGCHRLFGSTLTIVKRIKKEIKAKLNLTASIGVAPTKYLAKYAAGINKPDGFYIITPEQVDKIIPKIPVEKISGIGPKLTGVLHRLGIFFLGDILNMPEEYWQQRLGKVGYWLFNVASGNEIEPVTPAQAPKSMGNEFTLTDDTSDIEIIRKHLLYLSHKVSWRLRKSSFKAKTLTLKVRDANFFTTTMQKTFEASSSLPGLFFETAMTLFKQVNLNVKKIRLLGLTASNLIPVDVPHQPFLLNYNNYQKNSKLIKAVDKIWREYGDFTIKPAVFIDEQEESEG